MISEALAKNWEYCHLGPAESFQGLLGELKSKTTQGWQLAGVTNDARKVYATVKRPMYAAGPVNRVA